MDSIILIGAGEEKLPVFLQKMGYSVHACSPETPLPALMQKVYPDLVVLDDRFETDAIELLTFLRNDSKTREVPVLYLARDAASKAAVVAEKFSRIEIVSQPFRIGSIISKVATQLRLRKINGADEESATLGEINARLRDLNDTFTKQLEEARKIQESLVPASLPADDRFGIAVSYEALEEVGGDWYYVQQEEDGKLRTHCADVTGHGLSAAFIGSMTKLAMSAAGPCPPDAQLQIMNRLMAPNIPAGKFVTMISYLYDPETGQVAVARAGHPPALLLRRALKEVQQIKGEGFAIGFFEESEYTLEKAQLDPGDVLVVFSDAIPESQNMSGKTYDYERLSQLLLQSPPELSASKLLLRVLNDFDDFREGRVLKDDVTVILLKRES